MQCWLSVFNFSKTFSQRSARAGDYQVFFILCLDQNLVICSWSLTNFAQIHFDLQFLQIHFVLGELDIFLLDKRIGCWVSHRQNSKFERFVLSSNYGLTRLFHNLSLRHSSNFSARRIQSKGLTLLGSCSPFVD